MPVSDPTLDLLIDHLRDLYLLRIADRSEPYVAITLEALESRFIEIGFMLSLYSD